MNIWEIDEVLASAAPKPVAKVDDTVQQKAAAEAGQAIRKHLGIKASADLAKDLFEIDKNKLPLYSQWRIDEIKQAFPYHWNYVAGALDPIWRETNGQYGGD